MKYLIAAGCSFIEGASMIDKHSYGKNVSIEKSTSCRMSKLLSTKLNSTEVNLGSSGGSNYRSIRLTYEWIKANKAKVKDSTIVIGLTELFRSEKYSTKTQSYVKWRNTIFFQNEKNLSIINDNPHKLIPSSFTFHELIEKENLLPSLIEYVKTDLTLFCDIKYELDKLEQQLTTLSAYIEKHGGRLVVFSAMMEDSNLQTTDIDFFNFPTGFSWRNYISSYDDDFHPSHHPAVKDDEILSNLLYDHINK